MKRYNCQQCKKEFESRNKRTFCSEECYYFFRKGKKQNPISVEKRRQKMIGQKYSVERRKNIGLSRIKTLSPEIEKQLYELLDFGMPDCYILKNVEVCDRVYKRYKKKLFPEGVPWQLKFLESDITPEVIEEILKYCRLGYRYKRIAKCTGVFHKTTRRIIQILSKKYKDIKLISYDGVIERKESQPEKKVREILIKNSVEYKQEKQIEIGNKWTFDFHIINTNLLIEVQGDYWHCNPFIYEKPINKYQEWARKRDFAKRDYAKKLGYKVLALWEWSINNKLTEIEERIKEEINKCKLEQ